MAYADGSIIVNTSIDDAGFVAGTKDLEKAAAGMSKSVEGIGKAAQLALEKQAQAFVKANQTYAAQQQKVEGLKQKIADLGNTKVKTDFYREIEQQIDITQKKLTELNARQERFLETGGKTNSSTYERLQYDIEQLTKTLEYAKTELTQLETTGEAFTTADATNELTQLATEEQKLEQMNQALNISFDALQGKTEEYNNAGGQTVSILSRLQKVVKNVVSLFGSMVKGAGKLITRFSSLNKSNKKLGSNLSTGLIKLMKYSLGIRSLYTLINKLKTAFTTGSNNLVQYSKAYDTSISSIKNGITQLENQVAAAAEPFINLIAPAIERIISLLTEGISKAGQFIAALTGATSFNKAKKITDSYAESLSGVSDSAKEASGSLNSLEELDVIGQQDAETSSTGTTSAADMFETVDIDAGIQSLADKFKSWVKNVGWKDIGKELAKKLNATIGGLDTKKVGKAVSDYFNDVFAFLNGFTTEFDFTGLGEKAGGLLAGIFENLNYSDIFQGLANIKTGIWDTIAGALNAINWQLVGNRVQEGLTSVDWLGILDSWLSVMDAKFQAVYGFFEGLFIGVNWNNIGLTLGTGINMIVNTLTGWLDMIPWETMGTSLADLVMGVFQSINVENIAVFLSALITGLFAAVIGFVEGIDWGQLTVTIWQFLKSLDWGGMIGNLFELIGSAIGAFASIILTSICELAAWIYEGFTGGLLEGFANIGSWIWDHIFKPFFDGICQAFGIASPSTVMAMIGGYIVSGLLNGLDGINEKFGAIWQGLVGVVKDPINTIIGFINKLLLATQNMQNGIADALNNIQVSFPSWLSDVTGIDSFGFNIGKWTAPQIPYLASGTVVPRTSGQFLAMLGDNNQETEIVSPLSTMKQALLEALQEYGGAGGEGEQEIILEIDGDRLFRWLVKKNRETYLQTHQNQLVY